MRRYVILAQQGGRSFAVHCWTRRGALRRRQRYDSAGWLAQVIDRVTGEALP